jgi:glyoxylase-like metal-dependent hydrolase (beta-lactamase superfamily II)
LQVIASPGHTPGSISLLDTRNEHLIAGDALQTRAGIAVSGDKRPWFPFPAFATWSKPTSLESAKKLVSLQPTLLAVGHGKMVEQPISLMQKVIERAASKWKEQS